MNKCLQILVIVRLINLKKILYLKFKYFVFDINNAQ